MKSPAELWWSDIAGPHSVVEQTVAALQEKCHVILDVPADLPWRHQLRSEVDLCLQERNNISVQEIDWADQYGDKSDIGAWILYQYAVGPVSDGYRRNSGRTIQQYIRQEGVLRGRVLWIKGLNETATRDWLEFTRSYHGSLVDGGLFVLECHSNDIIPSRTQRQVYYTARVCQYDLQLFNSILLEQSNRVNTLNEQWRRYAAAVCAELCQDDAELSCRLLAETDFLQESPLERLRALAHDGDFARRGRQANGEHVLWLVREEKNDELYKRIWTAQLQVAFPRIELERVRYIQTLNAQIATLLASEPVVQYDQLITEPLDMELGTLCHYMNQRRGEEGYYAIYVQREEDRRRLRLLHQLRNALAHVTCCTPQQLNELFSGATT